jgi:Flp pilus assembly protein TadG
MRDLIRRPFQRVRRLLRRDDRGAVGVLVGVLLGGGALLGIGAIVLDVGMLYVERAELQNGADAGALGVARTCALGACDPDVAPTYADANANRDGVSGVPLVCGVDSGGGLGGCPASTGAMVDCPTAPGSGNYVDVHTATEETGGATLLPPVLARALLGNGAYDGTTVNACARASWGAPATAGTFALTVSYCEWLESTGAGASFAPQPPYPPLPSSSFHTSLTLHNPSAPDTACPSGPAGSDGPGQFGWTTNDSNCSTVVTSGTYSADPGASSGSDCKAGLLAAWTSRTPVLIPIYRSSSGTGSGGTYVLEGFAAFVVTGYRVPGVTQADWLVAGSTCGAPLICVNGFFTQALVPGGGTIGGPNLGATIIALTG